MDDIGNKLKRSIMSVSLQQRKKKELKRYRKEINKLNEMDEDEVDLEYIILKSQYEHKKNILSIFMLTILISIFMNAWGHLYHFMEITIQFVTNQGNDMKTAQVVFMLTAIFIVFITVLILFLLISHTRRMHQIYKELLTVEEIRNKRSR